VIGMVVHFHRGEVTPRNAYIDGNVRVGMRQEASEGLSPGPCPFGEGRTGATAFEASTLCVFSYRHCLTITGPRRPSAAERRDRENAYARAAGPAW
jgi:hypothetical protein